MTVGLRSQKKKKKSRRLPKNIIRIINLFVLAFVATKGTASPVP